MLNLQMSGLLSTDQNGLWFQGRNCSSLPCQLMIQRNTIWRRSYIDWVATFHIYDLHSCNPWISAEQNNGIVWHSCGYVRLTITLILFLLKCVALSQRIEALILMYVCSREQLHVPSLSKYGVPFLVQTNDATHWKSTTVRDWLWYITVSPVVWLISADKPSNSIEHTLTLCIYYFLLLYRLPECIMPCQYRPC